MAARQLGLLLVVVVLFCLCCEHNFSIFMTRSLCAPPSETKIANCSVMFYLLSHSLGCCLPEPVGRPVDGQQLTIG